MTSTQTLSLQITPMQLPIAADTHRSQGVGKTVNPNQSESSETTVKTLLIRPGEPSEFVVQLRHFGDRPMQLDMQVEGDFPPDWCRIGMEGTMLLPGQSMEAVLYFQIPGDWFESDQVSGNIDRVGRLSVNWFEPDTVKRQIEWTNFRLGIRPRSLYLNFLPAIYQDVDFVGRLLKIFEESFEPTVQTLDSLWAYLDPLTAPEALLPFLAHWVGWDPNFYLTADRQRRFIRHAMEIYRWRGTKYGLRLYLHLATGLPLDEDKSEAEQHISIVESFGRGLVLGSANLGTDALVGGGRAFHFKVRLKVPIDSSGSLMLDESLIRQVIEQEKPAFCTYELQIEEEDF
ncbi:MAG: phage tail protein [Cyanobacteria bacterium]|nr:phage tail protein [Cyanobacteriota bacterium]